MNQQAENEITAMLNSFPQTSQNYVLLLATLEQRLVGVSDQAIIEAAQRFMDGEVTDQSKKFAPSLPEFIEEVKRRQEYHELLARPRIPPPVYRPGPLAPFEVARQKALAANSHRPVLFEDISNEQWRKLSRERQIPEGSVWVAALGLVYGPESKQSKAA